MKETAMKLMCWRYCAISIVTTLVFVSTQCFALDVVKWEKSKNPSDPRTIYKERVIEAALEKTVPEFGPYKFERVPMDSSVNNTRAQQMLSTGTIINTYVGLASLEWEKAAIPVRIPIRRGIVAYRLLLVHKDRVNDFKNVNTYEDLKQLKVGLQVGWTTTKVLEAAGFNVVKGTKFDSLFYMLDGGRFDYLPQGINEVYSELNKRSGELDLAVEPHLLLRIPAPTYIFVSKADERLAKRLEAGLEMMIADGTLKAMFDERFSDAIIQADMLNRRVIDIPNKLLPAGTPLDRKELWFDVSELKAP